ncbi:cytochrome c nitrite reductase small subunit [Selenomonas sp. TAMA-11512]|uniref:cytochrome c3 family protein n=1 Tax=Selenomonas sp. TAMA-11512 TaxID=3095337 RepID=UPI00308935C5|nr:cytochrome c nitrite reductase small subunit [Selenomonas sp. TAMA-11512]
MDIQRFLDLLREHTLKCILAAFIAGAALVGGTSFALSFSGSETFCGTCHAMQHEHATFLVSSHRNLACVDCHLPHDNPVHYMYEKGRSGMIDVYHEVKRDYPARIIISEDGEKIARDNCLRCHSATMSVVHSSPMDADTDCLKCHRTVAHGGNHLEGGIRVE